MMSDEPGLNVATLKKLISLELGELEKYIQKAILFSRQQPDKINPDLEKLLNSIHQFESSTNSEAKFSFTTIHSASTGIYHSTFITVYSFFEYSLKIVSQLIAYNSNTSVRKVNNFEKTYQHFYFLIEHLQLNIGELEGEWRRLMIYRDIRNSIVHHNSTLGKNISSGTRDFIDSNPEIELNEKGLFYIKNEKVLYDLMNTMKSFLEKLLVATESYQK